MTCRQEAQNILDAAARGAQDAVAIIFAVGATLIAFLSILEFLNAVLKYLGSLVNIENLTFEVIKSPSPSQPTKTEQVF